MAFERIRLQLEKWSDGRTDWGPVVYAMGNMLAATLEQNTPKKTGLLMRNLTWQGRPKREGAFTWSQVVGSWGKIGTPDDNAPTGTIAAFLEAHPEYRMGNESKEERRARRERAKERAETRVRLSFNPFMADRSRYAWWLLSLEARRVLQEERVAGRFGGESGVGAGRSPYFYAQEGSDLFPGARESADKAGIKPKMFYALSLEKWREQVKGFVQEVIRLNMGV